MAQVLPTECAEEDRLRQNNHLSVADEVGGEISQPDGHQLHGREDHLQGAGRPGQPLCQGAHRSRRKEGGQRGRMSPEHPPGGYRRSRHHADRGRRRAEQPSLHREGAGVSAQRLRLEVHRHHVAPGAQDAGVDAQDQDKEDNRLSYSFVSKIPG